MKLRDVLALSLGAAMVAACNSGEDSVVAEAEEPAPVLTPAPTPTAAPDGTALVAGSWDVNENPDGARAVFAENGGEPKLAIICDRMSGTVTMDIASSSQTPEAWRVDAGGEAARLDMAPVDGGLSAEIDPGLALFNAFSTQNEVVALTSPTGDRMQFPTHPGITRVLTACS
ncbi:hypothetical protein [Aurantiacibacter poecillastricola]|uniref:hypothetical protein n=1 Tax=Aurantiacibacter poecillastricola TaxID=3064385 RepID=UPI00273EF797|nr:hypothetical protein [Aurantiacibacter sp. 219JJ12-13]MDP5261573.1 hypothetical protein [Aurantiacibacter sp. 219JJ12-13]